MASWRAFDLAIRQQNKNLDRMTDERAGELVRHMQAFYLGHRNGYEPGGPKHNPKLWEQVYKNAGERDPSSRSRSRRDVQTETYRRPTQRQRAALARAIRQQQRYMNSLDLRNAGHVMAHLHAFYLDRKNGYESGGPRHNPRIWEQVYKNAGERDPETAKPLKDLNKTLYITTHGGLGRWERAQTEAATVLADALQENGYQSVGSDLSRFAKRMQRWIDANRAVNGFLKWDWPGRPKSEQWRGISERVDQAIREIEQQKRGSRAWHRRRPHVATIVLKNRFSSMPDVLGPFPITPQDVEDLPALRKWLVKNEVGLIGKLRKYWQNRGGPEQENWDYGYVELHRDGDKLTVFPEKGYDSITVELGSTKQRLTGRGVEALKDALAGEQYLQPALYARRLHRAGVTMREFRNAMRAEYQGEGVSPLDARFNLRRTVTPQRDRTRRRTSRGRHA